MRRIPSILLSLGCLSVCLICPMVSAGGLAASAGSPDVHTEEGVVFGEVDGQQLLLDVAQPSPGTEPRPAVILIHGGAMMFASRADLAVHARALADAGYVTFNIDYRLVTMEGRNPWPAQLDDAQRAVRWVRANAGRYGVDPDRICAYGHSAGGLLAAQLGTRDTRDNSDPALAAHSSRVICVVNMAGEMDLALPSLTPDGDKIFKKLLGGTPEEVPEAYRDFSPISHVDVETVPFLILHGANDDGVAVEHARKMTDALHASGVEVVYAEYPEADHFVWLDWNASRALTLAFLERHLSTDD